MKIEIKIWALRSESTSVSAVDLSLFTYDPARGIFYVPASDADVTYQIESPADLVPKLVSFGSESTVILFEAEPDAIAFARWLEDANEEALERSHPWNG